MKIQIDPSTLKPGQLFDARPKLEMSSLLTYRSVTFLLQSGRFVRTDTVRFNNIPVEDYDFFTEISHPQLVAALVKPGEQILAEVSARDMHLTHMLMGICGEAGELLDALKKAIIYRKPLDRANVVEELGDLEWYLEGMRQELGITREETLDANILKLSQRYAKMTYSNTAAVARADKEDQPQ